MPWHRPFTPFTFSPAPAADSSPTGSPGSSPSSPSSWRSFPAASSPSAGPGSRSGTTCGPSAPTTPKPPTLSPGCASTPPSSSSRAGFPARTSPRPGPDAASRASAPGSGANLPESFAKYDPGSRSWKIPLCLLGEGWDEFSGTWPRSGMMLGGTCYPLPPWAPSTSANGSGSRPCWPTVTVNGNYNRAGLSAKSGAGLATAVARWPTPNARDWKGGVGMTQGARNSPNLDVMVQRARMGGGGVGRHPAAMTPAPPATPNAADTLPLSQP